MKAYNIDWDADGEEAVDLPTEVEIPDGITEPDEIEDYLSDLGGFTLFGYSLEEG